jgi:hypothetical protein
VKRSATQGGESCQQFPNSAALYPGYACLAVANYTPRLKKIFRSLVEMQNSIDQAAFLDRKS